MRRHLAGVKVQSLTMIPEATGLLPGPLTVGGSCPRFLPVKGSGPEEIMYGNTAVELLLNV